MVVHDTLAPACATSRGWLHGWGGRWNAGDGPEPLTPSELLKRTFSLYYVNFRLFAGVAALMLVPATIIQILFGLLIQSSDDLLGAVLLDLISSCIDMAAMLATFAGCVTATAQLLHGRASILGAFDACVSRIPTLMRATLLFSLVAFGLGITLIGIPAVIFLAAAWGFAGHAVVLENSRARASLGRSWALTHGQRLRILGISLVVLIITGIATAFFALPSLVLLLREAIREGAGRRLATPRSWLRASRCSARSSSSRCTTAPGHCCTSISYRAPSSKPPRTRRQSSASIPDRCPAWTSYRAPPPRQPERSEG